MLKEYQKALGLIYKKAPLQKRKIERFLSDKSDDFYIEAESFVSSYSEYLAIKGYDFEFAVDAYLKMCKDMIICQVRFMKTGKYPSDDQATAFSEVYDSEEVMFGYMIGLGFSQFLWDSHYKMFKHLERELASPDEAITNYLEVGPGHGLFLKKAVELLPSSCKFTALDISKTSIAVTKEIMQLSSGRPVEAVSYFTEDFLTHSSEVQYDFIVVGEVLEHVEDPMKMLEKIYQLLSARGRAFISTCVNCPMTDHVYHFEDITQIRQMLEASGFVARSEQVMPVEDLPFDEVMRRKITVNYSAVVAKD